MGFLAHRRVVASSLILVAVGCATAARKDLAALLGPPSVASDGRAPASPWGAVPEACPDVIRFLLRDARPLLAEEVGIVKEFWRDMAAKRYWGRWIDDPADFLRFVRMKDYDAVKSELIHGVEVYGLRNYRAWKKADEMLANIPKGELKLSIELFSQVHKVTAGELFPFLQKIGAWIPEGLLPTAAGVIKKRWSIGKDPIHNPLSEEVYQRLKKDPWMGEFAGQHGFLELPWPFSKKGARRGWLIYGEPHKTEAKLKKLIEWYEANKATMDPIRLAADFQRAFVAIHPFVDGNGRTSRLLMDRILAEFDLPPPILADSTNDLYTAPAEWEEQVSEGVQRFYQYSRFQDPQPVRETRATNLAGFDRWGDSEAKLGSTAKKRVARHFGDFKGREMLLGNERFLLLPDGFLYTNEGIPYVFRDNKLWPISDRSYFLYEQGGRVLKGEAKNADRYGEGAATRRAFLPARRDVFRGHFELVRKLEAGKLDPKKIEVIGYEEVAAANRAGRFHLYPWQKDLVEQAVTIEGKSAVDVLRPSLRVQNTFENASMTADEIKKTPTLVLAQYEKLELVYRHYEKAVAENFPELLPKVRESRRKMHAAARELMKPFMDGLEGLSPAAREALGKTGRGRAIFEYLKRSKVSYASFEEGVRALPDDKVFAIRADAAAARWVGFLSQADYRRLLERIPGYESIKRKMADIIKEMRKPEVKTGVIAKLKELKAKAIELKQKYAKNVPDDSLLKVLPPDLRKLLTDEFDKTYDGIQGALELAFTRILGTKYSQRGSAEELERMSIEYLLHASGGYPAKEGTSFTSNIDLLIRSGTEQFAFTNGNFDARVFFVEMDLDQVDWNHVSGFASEYEYLAIKPISPRRIQTSMQTVELKPFYIADAGVRKELDEALKNEESGLGNTFSSHDYTGEALGVKPKPSATPGVAAPFGDAGEP
jgi:hypothetical protein